MIYPGEFVLCLCRHRTVCSETPWRSFNKCKTSFKFICVCFGSFTPRYSCILQVWRPNIPSKNVKGHKILPIISSLPQKSPWNKYKPQGSLSQFYAITNRDSCIYKRGIISSREIKSESELVIQIVSIPKVVPIKLFSFRSLPVSEIPEGSSSSQSCDANFTHVTAHAAIHGFSSSTKTFTLRAW